MDENLEAAKKLIDALGENDQRALYGYLRAKLEPHALETKWGITADVILGAIARAPDITQRGIRGVIAEAVFEARILPLLLNWDNAKIEGEQPYDFLLRERGGSVAVKIQVKLQRSEKGAAKRGGGPIPADFYVVEVQKTRTGTKFVSIQEGDTLKQTAIKTRPYAFGDFDILAVSMHPSSGDWSRFMYTVAAWLIPRQSDKNLIEIMQPVSEVVG